MKRWRPVKQEARGFTLVELLITMLLLGAVAASMLTLFVSLVHSSIIAKRQAVASTLATNQMEYLKSLPYDSLVIAGGSIYTTGATLPATKTQSLNGVKYTITSTISFIDDAYDGCGSYASTALKQAYCRNYPPPSSAPAVDASPYDYKIVDVTVTDPAHNHLAELDTEVAARIAESGTTKGALTVTIVDATGNSVEDANVNVADNSLSPALNLNGSTDQNGVFIFYDMPADTSGNHYVITASKANYSTLATIAPSGTLQPTYPNQNIIAQSSSAVTMTLKLQGPNSLIVEATDTSGNPIANLRPYIKGGYKKYTATTDTSYYYDNMSPSDTRPTTDSAGLANVSNLVPGNYIFCGDAGATNCKVGATTYYLAAAVPYGGTSVFNPITVPTYDSANPPATTYAYNSTNYYQKVRLILTTNSSIPRITNITPYDVSLSTGSPSTFSFVVNGINLPCSATASSCSTSVKFLQGSNTYTASCTGNSTAIQLNCTINLSSATAGNTQMVVSSGGNTLTIPSTLNLGGIIVTP